MYLRGQGMKILLVKCHKKTLFSRFQPIVTEPLELEYLSALLTKLNIHHKIHDSNMDAISFEEVFQSYEPDVVLLSGYVTAVDSIIGYSKYAKGKNSDTKVIVGGVHAEINYKDFFVDTIDVIIHSDGVNTLEKIIESSFDGDKMPGVQGIAYQDKGKWKVTSQIATDMERLPLPNRSYFKQHRNNTKYLHYSPISIVKTAISCPFNCNFCYCKLLNMGTYWTRPIESVIEEIRGIDSEYIWIVDDNFLIDRNRVEHFIDEVKRNNINKKFIAYSRVDFISKNEDIINKLGEIGLVELIVGMEAVEDAILDSFHKTCSTNENLKAVEILKSSNVKLTALFIVGIDFTLKGFKNLRAGIRKMGLKSYTASIFTPIMGTESYKVYENRLTTKDYSKWDFLHLVIKPVHLNPLVFYLNFYLIYVELFFRSKTIRSFLLKNIKNILRKWRV